MEDSFEDSIEIRKKILEELDDNGRDVVLAVHSYGGICGTNACEGLAKKDREGKNTSVIGTVYLAVSADPAGFRRKWKDALVLMAAIAAGLRIEQRS